jgi:hypothetical protein
MRRRKVFCLALLSVLAVGVMFATAASAESTPLPDIHTALPGETYPIDLGGKTAVINQSLRNAVGGVLEGSETSVLLSALELTSLGLAVIVLLGVKEAISPNRKCGVVGSAQESGEVVFPNAEYHLVYTALSPGENLELAALVLFTNFPILCGPAMEAVEIPVRGPSMVRVNPTAGTAGDGNALEIASHCSSITAGAQELPYYYNDQLERVATTLLINVLGAGFKPGCEEIPGTILLTPETGSLATMFTVLW